MPCNCGNSCFTRSTTSMTLVPGWRWMLRMIAGRGVRPRGEPRVLGRFDRFGDVLHAHRRTVLVGDDQALVLVGRFELIVGVDRRRARRSVEAALRLIGVGVGDRGAHVVERQPVRGDAPSGSPGCAIAGRWPPLMLTRPTPGSCEIFCAIRVSARSSSFVSGSVCDVSASVRIGVSAGIDLVVDRRVRQVRRQEACPTR